MVLPAHSILLALRSTLSPSSNASVETMRSEVARSCSNTREYAKVMTRGLCSRIAQIAVAISSRRFRMLLLIPGEDSYKERREFSQEQRRQPEQYYVLHDAITEKGYWDSHQSLEIHPRWSNFRPSSQMLMQVSITYDANCTAGNILPSAWLKDTAGL